MRAPTDRRLPTAPPVLLLADSAPFFASHRLFAAIRAAGERRGGWRGGVRAVYVGASNGDAPEYFEVFAAAMQRADAQGVAVARAEQIRSRFAAEDRRSLDAADWIVLAGGDVERGWRVMADTGMDEAIRRRRRDGALLVGVSAGAVQLGVGALTEASDWVDTFGLVPQVVDVHDERDAWRRLERAVAHRAASGGGSPEPGVGIPGGGAVQASIGPAGELRLEPLAGTVLRTVEAQSRVPGAAAPGPRQPCGRDGHANDD